MMGSLATGPPAARNRNRRSIANTSSSTSSSPSSKWSSTWRKNRLAILGAGLFCFTAFSLLPILVLESLSKSKSSVSNSGNSDSAHVSVHKLLDAAKNVQQSPIVPILQNRNTTRIAASDAQHHPHIDIEANIKDGHAQQAKPPNPKSTLTRHVPKTTLADLTGDEGWTSRPVNRGLSGRPIAETPAMVGAKRAHIECKDINVDALAYWNDPQGSRDLAFTTPFAYNNTRNTGGSTSKVGYISFSPDRGGWNNVRMSMEIIFVIAAATGRTLVLPPKEPLYLLNKAAPGTEIHRGFADFFPLHSVEFQKRVKTISMKEFLEKEGNKGGVIGELPADQREGLLLAADHCDHRKAAANFCDVFYGFLESTGHVPKINNDNTCLVFDQAKYNGAAQSAEIVQHVATTCGTREVVYWDSALQDIPWIHFKASHKDTRLLTHFYAMIHFTNPAIDNYYKRFVRDFLHYHDSIFCAAGKIVKALQKEAAQRGHLPDPQTGSGGYSSLHVRRGDLQFKVVKIPSQEWYNNTKELWLPNELLYVATDERDKAFFDDLSAHYDLRFLDDYWDLAGLATLDGNYMGMIDTIVASRGRVFAGTWFSTFTGYINRMRGYHGMSMMDSWYSFLPKKEAVHEWNLENGSLFAKEWPDGWIGIDADVWPVRGEKF